MKKPKPFNAESLIPRDVIRIAVDASQVHVGTRAVFIHVDVEAIAGLPPRVNAKFIRARRTGTVVDYLRAATALAEWLESPAARKYRP